MTVELIGPTLHGKPPLTDNAKRAIDAETRRQNPVAWRLEPWTRAGRRRGFVRLSGVTATGQRVLIARLSAPDAESGDALYHALNAWLAARRDWDGFEEVDGDDAVLTAEGIDWEKLEATT